MTIEEFIETLDQENPPENLSPELQALWFDAKGRWDVAHQIVQYRGSEESAWVHAYLHRKEPDIYNASYWYHIANKTMPNISFEQEWREITMALLESK